MMNSFLTGNLVLLEEGKHIGKVRGRVVDSNGGQGVPRQHIDICREGKPVSCTMSDSRGYFEYYLLDGAYTIQIQTGTHAPKATVTVSPGETAIVELSAPLIRMPDLLQKSISLYTSLNEYRDITEVEAVMGVEKTIFDFSYRSPKRFSQRYRRIESSGCRVLTCDGHTLTADFKGEGNRIEKKVSGELNVFTLSSILHQPCGGFVHQLILSENALKRLEDSIISVKTIGTDRIDGVAADIIEIVTRADTFTTLTRRTTDYSIIYRLWIGQEDKLIRKVVTEMEERLDVAAASNDKMVTKIRSYTLTHHHRVREVHSGLKNEFFVQKL
jgi:hypothetical protein